MNTTLNEIKKHGPCGIKPEEDGELTGWLKLLDHLGKKTSDDEPLSFATILESNGIDDAVWCLQVLPLKEQMHFRADIAELVLPIWEAKHPDDMRPREAIQGCRDFADGKIDERELDRLAAAARAARAAGAANFFVGYAAGVAAYAARSLSITYVTVDAGAYANYQNIWPIERLFVNYFCGEEA